MILEGHGGRGPRRERVTARDIDEAEADRRLDFYLDLDAQLIRQLNPLPMLH